jgi:hypothetical protein
MVVVSGNVVSAGTISSPWTPVTGPPADSNGAGPDTKNLDVGDVSDVSVSTSPITLQLLTQSQNPQIDVQKRILYHFLSRSG